MAEPSFVINEGIVIGGSAQVGDSAIAAGPHAQAHFYGAGGAAPEDFRETMDAILAQVEHLRQLIEVHAAELPGTVLAVRDVGDVRDEIVRARSGQPADGDRLRHALERLTGRVAAVGALAIALDKLKDAILSALR